LREPVRVDCDNDPSGYADAFTGYDMPLFLNLSNHALLNPELGIVPAEAYQQFAQVLLTEGYLNDPAFGGGGPLTLGSLGGGDVYAPLVPIGDSIINALASGTRPIRGGSLTDGGALYLTTTMTSVPEPGSLALLGTGMLCLAFLSLRRARQRPVQA
jgi:hypothetical protein